jgi:hypothetical protein
MRERAQEKKGKKITELKKLNIKKKEKNKK